MAQLHIRFLLAGLCVMACNLQSAAWAQSQSQDPVDTPGAAAAAQAFSIRILAPQELRDVLERHLELKRYQVLSDLSDTEIQSLLQSAQQNVLDLVATLGYFTPEVRISLQRHKTSTGTEDKEVLIEVQAGPQTRVGTVQLVVEGAIASDASDTRAQEQLKSVRDLWSLDTGEKFSQAAWDKAKQDALKQLLVRRYPTASVQESQAEVHPEDASVDLQLRLDSGPAYTLGSLELTGDQRYGLDLPRRLAHLPLGQDYALDQLVDAQQRLTDSGYYDSAYLNLDLSSPPEEAVVRGQLKEASMQKLVFGVGASTDSGARISAEHTYNRVPGIDWRAVNKVTLSRNSKSFASDWTSEPEESRWRWAASALTKEELVSQIDIFTERLRLGRFTTDVVLDQSYYLQYERAEAVYREIDQSSNNEALSVNYAFSWRHFDSKLFPNRGWGLGGELSAGTVLGSKEEPFTRALLHASYIQPLGQSLGNLFERQHAGRMMYRAQAGGVVVNNATAVPFTQLFLTGGDTTVRGYRYQEIGVTHDGVLSADAGRYVATASAEWQRPVVLGGLMTDWETAVFVDTGAVANRIEEFSFKSGVGVGARWRSPIGPLQIDLAYGLATQAFRLHLNVGFQF